MRNVVSRGVVALMSLTLATGARAQTMSAGDLLDVATASIADLSDDGRWLALTITIRRDALGVEAARDGDPTYLRITPAQLFAVNAQTLERTPVFAGKRSVRNAT